MEKIPAHENPFRVERIHALRYRLPGIATAEVLQRWEANGRRGALVGPHGRGKSTLLAELQPEIARAGLEVRLVELRQHQRALPQGALRGISPNTALLIDGAEQLPRWRWHLLRWRARRAGGILITAHRAGLLPTIAVCTTPVDVLLDLVRELCPAATPALLDRASALHETHHGDIRQVFFALYDACAEGAR